MIDIHSHVVPRELPFAVRGDDRWPRLVLEGRTARVMIDGQVFRVVRDVCWDMDARLEEIGRAGITMQVISPMPELFSYWAPARQASDYCLAMNDWISARVDEHPDHLAGLGIVPLQDLERSCELLASVKAAGLRGIEIGSNVEGAMVGTAAMAPLFEEAERLSLCVLVHSFHPLVADQVPPWAVNGATFPLEAGLATAGLVCSGVLDRLSDARIAITHGGGSAAFVTGRLQYLWEKDAQMKERLGIAPIEALRRLYYDSLVFSEAALRFLVGTVGETKVCLGTDYPFFVPEAGIDPLRCLCGDEVTSGLLREANARRFLGL